MLQYNEIREKRIIIYSGEPCEVIDSRVARTQQRKPQNQVKLRSLISGKTFSATFHVSDTAVEADVAKRDVKFLYHHRDEYWFSDPQNPKDRFKLDLVLLGVSVKFLKANENITALFWISDGEERIIQLALPIKIDFVVKSAPPAVRGDTSKGGNKIITLENGTTINAPMFINEGDVVRINTETGEYVERA